MSIYAKSIILSVLLFAAPAGVAFAQSNSCGSATALTLSTPTSGTCASATSSISSSNCSAGGYLDPLDVWYKFTTTGAGAYVITLNCSGSFDGVIELRTSACNGSSLQCRDNVGGGATETMTTGALTASTTYNVRIYPYDCCPGTWTFTITVAPNCSNPTITTHPSNSAVCAAGNTSFTAAATGTSLTYQWQEFAGASWANISNGGIYSNATTTTLNLTGVTSGMNGYQYRCVVSSSGGCPVNTNAATLTVNTAPSISAHPPNNTICVGGSSNMSVTASGTSLTYSWEYFNGSWNAVANGSPAGAAYSNQTTATMTVAGISGSGSYQYRCVISGTCAPSATSNAATLTVNADPSITAQPSSPAICSGTNTNLSVTVSNGVSLSYSWEYFNGSWNAVSNGSPAGSSYSNQTTATISINGISAAGSYSYRCIITDAGNGCTTPLTSGTGVVTVNATPPITSQPSNQTVCTSTNANFTVATSAGSPAYQWQMSSDNATWFNVANGTPAGITYTNGTTATLTVNGTSSVALYYYRCVITASGCSANSNSAQLVIQNPSTAAASASASSVSFCNGQSTTLTLSGGSLGTGAAWKWYSGSCGGTLAGTGSSITVSPASNTTYYVRAEGCNTTACVSVAVTVTSGGACSYGLRTFGLAGSDIGYSIIQNSDQTYVIAGVSDGIDGGSGWTDGYIMKLNTDASFAWARGIGSNSGGNQDVFSGLTKDASGNYMVAGRGMDATYTWQLYAAKFPANGGTPSWTKAMGVQDTRSVNDPTCGAADQAAYDVAYAVAKTSDDGIVTAGFSNIYYSGVPCGLLMSQIYVVKLDNSGNFVWQRELGFGGSVQTNDDTGMGVVENADGTVSVVGYTGIGTNNSYDIALVKLTAAGAVSWTRTIGGALDDYGYAICKTSDGGIVIAGETESGAGGSDAYIAKIDATGNRVWDATLGGASNEVANAVIETSDGGYVIAGSTSSYGEAGTNAYIAKFNGSGTLQWTQVVSLGIGATEVANAIVQTNDQGFAFAGRAGSDILFGKLTSAGFIDIACGTTSGGTATAQNWNTASPSANNSAPGSIRSAALLTNNIAGTDNLILSSCGTISPMPVELMSFSAGACEDGNCVNLYWQTASETNNDYFTLERSVDGKSWMPIGTVKGAGNSSVVLNYEWTDTELPAGMRHQRFTTIYYRLKQTDYDGKFKYSDPVPVKLMNSEDWEIFIQNPATNQLAGTLITTESTNIMLEILDLQGRVIARETSFRQKGSHLLMLDIQDLEKGLYFIRVSTEKKNIINKFVKE